MVDAGEIFHPLRWTSGEAAPFLVQRAATWKAPAWSCACRPLGAPTVRRGRRSRRRSAPARRPRVGLDGLLDFRMDVTLEGEPLSDEEIATLLAGTDTLVLLRGRWVEIDRDRLERAMRQFREARGSGRTRRPDLRRGDAPAGRRGGYRRRPGPGGCRLVARDGRPLAGRDAEGPARPGWRGRRSRPGPEGNLAALSEGGRAMAASAVRARPGRLPRRRHGPRQDDPGAVAAAGRKRRKEHGTTPEPAGGAGVPARQLGRGNRAVRPQPERRRSCTPRR